MIPDKIKLADGTEHFVAENPELMVAFQTAEKDAAKLEKDKIYPMLEEYRKTIAPLTKMVSSLKPSIDKFDAAVVEQRKVAEKNQELTQTITSENISNSETTPSTLKEAQANAGAQEAKAQVLFNNPEEVRKLVKGVFDEAISPVMKKVALLEGNNVETYRDKLLAAHAGTIVNELVQGTTVEELNASVAMAKEAFLKYVPAPASAPAPAQQGTTAPITEPTIPQPEPAPVATTTPETLPPTTTTPGTQTPSEASKPMDFKSMSNEEFGASREAGLKKLSESL